MQLAGTFQINYPGCADSQITASTWLMARSQLVRRIVCIYKKVKNKVSYVFRTLHKGIYVEGDMF